MPERDSEDLVAASHPKRHNFSSIIGVKKISDEMRRTWNCIGHVLRKERNDDCMVAMEWQPQGKRRVGRAKTTWRRTVEKESRQDRWASGPKSGAQRKIGLVDGKTLQPYALYGPEITN